MIWWKLGVLWRNFLVTDYTQPDDRVLFVTDHVYKLIQQSCNIYIYKYDYKVLWLLPYIDCQPVRLWVYDYRSRTSWKTRGPTCCWGRKRRVMSSTAAPPTLRSAAVVAVMVVVVVVVVVVAAAAFSGFKWLFWWSCCTDKHSKGIRATRPVAWCTYTQKMPSSRQMVRIERLKANADVAKFGL